MNLKSDALTYPIFFRIYATKRRGHEKFYHCFIYKTEEDVRSAHNFAADSLGLGRVDEDCGGVMCYCRLTNKKSHSILPEYLGHIALAADSICEGYVSHEMTHAALRAAHYLGINIHNFDKSAVQERFCYLQQYMVQQFYDHVRKIIKKKHNGK